MHLKQPKFTYSACGPFTKKKERIQKFKEAGDSRYIYIYLFPAWYSFQHDKVLRDKAFDIAKNQKYGGYQRGFGSMVYNFFDKKFASLAGKSVTGSGIKNEIK